MISMALRFFNRLGILVVLSLVLLFWPGTSPVVTTTTLEGIKNVKEARDCGGSGTTTTISDINNSTRSQATNYPENGLCSFLANQRGNDTRAASSLLDHDVRHWWRLHVDDILAASQQPASDPDFVHESWMKLLLYSVLTPDVLARGIRSRPQLPSSVQTLAEMVYERFKQQQQRDNNEAEETTTALLRPIRIAVVGGSVTVGRGCPKPPPGFPAGPNNPRCAWAPRLQDFINQLVGFELLQVHNLAVGGTGLTMATPLVKYWLYPPALLPEGPDVIISAYATNQEFTYPYRADTTNSTKFADTSRQTVQEFLQAVNQARPCDARPPLVIFLDDYLGNQQDRILGETTYNKIVTELADWYGNVLHVSYADVVRRFVYANTDHALFTPAWPRGKNGDTAVEVHFGMVGHVVITWVLGFALLDLVASYCENQAFVHDVASRLTQNSSSSLALVDQGILHRINNVLPPPLTKDTTLSSISQQWKQVEDLQRINQQENCNEPDFGKPPCAFAFLAGPAGTVRNPRQLAGYMGRVLQSSQGWNAVDDYSAGGYARKLGYVASEANATFTLRMTNLAKEVRLLSLQTLKSYGDKWANSTALFSLTVSNPAGQETQAATTHSFEIQGFHDSPTRYVVRCIYVWKQRT